MRLRRRIIAMSGLLGLGVAGSVAAAGSATAFAGGDGHGHGGCHRCGYVYVNDNTAGTNTIAGFLKHRDGSLTPLPGSPFPADGAGTGSGIGSQGALQQSSDGRYLLAVDAGSNQISVLKIGSGGRLTLVGSPVSSGGTMPVSIAVHHSLVYVANASGMPNFTGFTINSAGVLAPLAGSTVTLPSGSLPGDVLFNGTGAVLAGTLVDSSQVVTFTVGSGGLLTPAPGEFPLLFKRPCRDPRARL